MSQQSNLVAALASASRRLSNAIGKVNGAKENAGRLAVNALTAKDDAGLALKATAGAASFGQDAVAFAAAAGGEMTQAMNNLAAALIQPGLTARAQQLRDEAKTAVSELASAKQEQAESLAGLSAAIEKLKRADKLANAAHARLEKLPGAIAALRNDVDQAKRAANAAGSR